MEMTKENHPIESSRVITSSPIHSCQIVLFFHIFDNASSSIQERGELKEKLSVNKIQPYFANVGSAALPQYTLDILSFCFKF